MQGFGLWFYELHFFLGGGGGGGGRVLIAF